MAAQRVRFPLQIETMKKIDPTKNMAQLLGEYPQLAQILSRQGIECAACLASQVDTLVDVTRMYRLDLNSLIKQVQAQGGDTAAGTSPDGPPDS